MAFKKRGRVMQKRKVHRGRVKGAAARDNPTRT